MTTTFPLAVPTESKMFVPLASLKLQRWTIPARNGGAAKSQLTITIGVKRLLTSGSTTGKLIEVTNVIRLIITRRARRYFLRFFIYSTRLSLRVIQSVVVMVLFFSLVVWKVNYTKNPALESRNTNFSRTERPAGLPRLLLETFNLFSYIFARS